MSLQLQSFALVRMPFLAVLSAVDGKNNARAVGGDAFHVSITGPAPAPVKPFVKDNLNGCEAAFPCQE